MWQGFYIYILYTLCLLLSIMYVSIVKFLTAKISLTLFLVTSSYTGSYILSITLSHIFQYIFL